MCEKNHTLSSPLLVTPRVPQGSVLGSLLYRLYVNNTADNVVNSSFYLFTCDLKTFRVSSDSLVHDDINSLLDWRNVNGPQFYPTKCKILNFGGHVQSAHFLIEAEYQAVCQSVRKFRFQIWVSVSSSR